MSKLKVETEWDKNITALARSLTECKISKYNNICKPADCARCSKYKQQQNVWNSMADIDRLRVNTESSDMYNAFLLTRYKFIEDEEAEHRDKVGSFLMIGFILLILVMMLFCCSATKPVSQRDIFESNIENCLRQVRILESDVNKDGVINCQDYALLFYKAWLHSDYDDKTVALVLNNNEKTGMNHLFCAVRLNKYASWEYIEPQAWLIEDYYTPYDMQEYWGNKYNKEYNMISTQYLYTTYYTNKIRGKK